MSQELADLFEELRGIGHGMRTAFGTVTSVSPLRVRLDSMDSGDIGPLAAIRAIPAMDERVLLFETPDSRSYVVLGKSTTECGPAGTPCVNFHWPPKTTIGSYILAADSPAHDQLTASISVGSTVSHLYVEIVDALRLHGSFSHSQVDIRLYCPGAWTGSVAGSPTPPYEQLNVSILDGIPGPYGQIFDVATTGLSGTWTLVVTGRDVTDDLPFNVKAWTHTCCDGPSTTTYSQHITVPSGVQFCEAEYLQGFTVPLGATSIYMDVVYDDLAALLAYDPSFPWSAIQARIFAPGEYRGDYDALETGMRFVFDTSGSLDGPTTVPFNFARGSGPTLFGRGGDGEYAIYNWVYYAAFRLDMVAGEYVAIWGPDFWNGPSTSDRPPFDVGLTITITVNFCNAANDAGGYP